MIECYVSLPSIIVFSVTFVFISVDSLVDDQPPVITNCPQNMNLNVELGTSSVPVSWVEPSAVDNSGVANLISQSHFPNTLFNIGSTTVTYVYSDESNNIAQCSFVVTVTAGECS